MRVQGRPATGDAILAKPTLIAPRAVPPVPGIRIGKSDRADAETRFGTLLVGYMRLLALLWLAQGVSSWGLILLGDDFGPGPLARMTDLGATAVIFFAVMDLVAAVGLWLAASWGGVVWLVTVAAQWLCLVILPNFFPYDLTLGAVDVLLVLGYFVFIYRAAREIDV